MLDYSGINLLLKDLRHVEGRGRCGRVNLDISSKNTKLYYNYYNFGVDDPICTKLHMMDNSPALNTSTSKNSVIVIAPPAGNRKYHVLHFEVLL